MRRYVNEGKTIIRRAVLADIDRLIEIRGSVRENRLLDPTSVSREDYDWFVTRELVWVAGDTARIAGFSAADPRDGTIWALFVDPECEGGGLGTVLLDKACNDLKVAGYGQARLSTDPGTKAARLYLKLGWQERGQTEDGEIAFEFGL